MPFPKAPVGEHDHLLEIYETEAEVEYRGERYRVRDNGAVYRLNEFRKRARPLDKTWTFGRQNLTTGYQLLAGVPIHRIVCSAFNGPPPTDQHVVDHIDTNRANNRPENLRWLTMDLSRFSAAPSARLGHFPFECDRAFPAQC